MDSVKYRYINLSYLELMSDGDIDMKKVMLEMLLKELPEEIKKMHLLQLESNWEQLRAVSHKMKSTLSFIGNDQLTAANSTIEQIAKTETNLEKLPDLLLTINKMQPLVFEELKAEYDKL